MIGFVPFGDAQLSALLPEAGKKVGRAAELLRRKYNEPRHLR
jgi:hypothetical protein